MVKQKRSFSVIWTKSPGKSFNSKFTDDIGDPQGREERSLCGA